MVVHCFPHIVAGIEGGGDGDNFGIRLNKIEENCLALDYVYTAKHEICKETKWKIKITINTLT